MSFVNHASITNKTFSKQKKPQKSTVQLEELLKRIECLEDKVAL